MRFPVVRGIIDRRILINFRADPAVVAQNLPAPFRPQVVNGFAVVGICLIRLKHIRPGIMPAWCGITSENAAHRTAVEWDDRGTRRQCVFVRRRDTDSWLNVLGGGRVFPGVHSHASFAVDESDDRFSVTMTSDDGLMNVAVRGQIAATMPESSLFGSIEEASAFFRNGSLGYSTTREPARFERMELRCHDWDVSALAVDEVRSSVFEDKTIFPTSSIAFDSAMVMRGLRHEWHGHADLCCSN